ncbi:glycosyltransferase family 2 protein [Opitutales bacterium]|nr:glycosyltransferase family 2 protein [Opitutales bacterium]
MRNKLSVVIPVFNEEKTLSEVVRKVLSAEILSQTLEIIIVDDCSSDSTWEVAKDLKKNEPRIKITRHEINLGKGASLRTGFSESCGQIVLIQDGDLEYDPKDYPSLLKPILEEKADVVYGSRFRSNQETRVLYFWHRIANGILTLCSNMFTNLNLTDMETGYKVFRKDILDKIVLQEDRFGIEPEITAKIAQLVGIRIYEIGISYSGRTYAEGKKIGLKDAFRAIYAIIKYGFFCGKHSKNNRNK